MTVTIKETAMTLRSGYCNLCKKEIKEQELVECCRCRKPICPHCEPYTTILEVVQTGNKLDQYFTMGSVCKNCRSEVMKALEPLGFRLVVR